MDDKSLGIHIRVTGDTSGADAVNKAIDTTGDASRKSADEASRNFRRITAEAGAAATAIRDTGTSGGGRSWAIPPPGAVPSSAAVVGPSAPVSVPLPSVVAPRAAPSVSAPSSGEGGASNLDDLEKGAESAGKAADQLSGELEKAATASGKITPAGPDALAEGMRGAGDEAEGAFAKFTGIDSVTDELEQLAEKAKEFFEGDDGGKKAAALEATAEAAKKAGEAQKEAQNEAGNAADKGAEKQAKFSSAFAENAKKVTEAIKAKQAASAAAAEDEKGEQEKLASAYSENTKKVVEAIKAKQAASTTASGDEEQSQDDASEGYSENVQKVLDALKEKKKATEEAGDAEDEASKKTDKMGRAAATAAQLLDDAQYGFGAIVNNIPGIVEGLGLGAGVAGVAGIAAVAVNQLIKRFDVFGSDIPEAIKRTAAEIGKMTTELAKSRNEAQQAAEDWNKAFASGKKHETDLENISRKYKNLVENINAAADARRQLNIAILEQSNEEMALDLAEVELQRTEGKITDIDAMRKSHEIRKGYTKAQFEFSRDARQKERDDIQKNLADLADTYEQNSRKYSELSSIGKNLLPEKDFEILKQNEAIATSQREAARKKVQETPETVPDTNPASAGFSPGLEGEASVAVMVPNPDYAKAVEREKQTQEYSRKMTDRLNEVKEARERAGLELQDKNRLDEKLKELGKLGDDTLLDMRNKARKDAELARTDETEKLKFKTTSRLEDVQDKIQIRGQEQQQAQKAQQKADEELAEKRRLEDVASGKYFDAMEKAEKAQRAEDAARNKGRKRNRGGAADADTGAGNSVAEMRKDFEEKVAEARRQQDAQTKLDREAAERKKLSSPDREGPVEKPAEWQGPKRAAGPSGPVTYPEPEGTTRERINIMKALDRVPDAANKWKERPRGPVAPSTPDFDAGTGTEGLTSSMDQFIRSKRTASDRLGGGDPRLNELQKANDALKDGATAGEMKRLSAAIAALGGTILATSQQSQTALKSLTAQVNAITTQIKQGRK